MKLAFVAHEFGIFPNHGGIASYLFQIVDCLLSGSQIVEVDIICLAHGKDDELTRKYPGRFRLHKIKPVGSAYHIMASVRELLAKVKPDVVEVADYLGLAKLALLDKRFGIDFLETTFVTNHHTASQEIYEWCNEISASFAPPDVKRNIMNEQGQIWLSDANIAPSQFLAAYDTKRYELSEPMSVFPNPYSAQLRSQTQVRAEKKLLDPDADRRKFTIVLVSRFEPRKNQARLVREFASFLLHLEDEGESIEGIELHMAGNSVPLEIGGHDYRQHVRRLVDSRFRDHVHFWDFLKLDEQDHLVAMADLAVMPSTFENFPVAMVETVLRGIPVMGSRHSGVADYATADAELLTFDPFKNGDLSDNLLKFYRASKSVRQAILQRQTEELNELLDPRTSVFGRVEYYQSLMQEPATSTEPSRCLKPIFAAPRADQTSDQLDSYSTCRELINELDRRDPKFTHVTLCLLSNDEMPDRLLQATSADDLKSLGEHAIAFTTEDFIGDLSDVLVHGHALLLPNISRERLSESEPTQTIYELLILEAIARKLVVDNSAKPETRIAEKPYIDFCFCRRNYFLDKIASEVVSCPSKPCSSTVRFKEIATEKSSEAFSNGSLPRRLKWRKSSSASMPVS